MNKSAPERVPAEAQFINIEKVIASKNAALLKWMPRFLLNYIKRTIHQDELNAAIYRNRDKYELEFVQGALDEFGAKVRVYGQEHVPLNGGVILASNHPLGGLDGIALMQAAGSIRPDIRFLVNDLLLNLKNFGRIFIPVNKHGRNSAHYLQKIEEVYAGNVAVLVFPAGLVSRDQGGIIKDLEWKKSFISKAIKYQKDVIPVYIDGRNSAFFYGLAKWRKRLGIKANIEMFFLVDEMYKQRNKTISIYFGKPIPWQTFSKTGSNAEWSEYVKEHVYNMEKEIQHKKNHR